MTLSTGNPERPERNVCSYKAVCNGCTMCETADRPQACLRLECEYYTPCKKCSKNLETNTEGICKYCQKNIRDKVTLEQIRTSSGAVALVPEALPNKLGLVNPVISYISIPGVPPANFTPEEVTYYEAQWAGYQGYYRDPTAYAICHHLILEEIHLAWLTGYMHAKRGEAQEDTQKQRSKSIENLKNLRAQLPERDAMEMSDDDKALSMIHEAYAKEKGLRAVGPVARIISPEAIALAPQLLFPIDIRLIMSRLGYSQIQVDEALSKFFRSEELPQDPAKLLEFFGFFLKERYALDYNVEDLDDGDNNALAVDEDFSEAVQDVEFKKKNSAMNAGHNTPVDEDAIAFSTDAFDLDAVQ